MSARVYLGTVSASALKQVASPYKRVLLKLSGEALLGKRAYGIDPTVLDYLASEIKQGFELGVQLGIVIGGGNIFRGQSAAENGMDRVAGDYCGMLATVMNGVALKDALERANVPTRVMSSIRVDQIAEPYILNRALRHFEKGRVVIFVGGTGNPYFTTDTTAALRAAEIKADVLFKATKVDGIYDKDPFKHKDAVRFDRITYTQALAQRLQVMDSTAFSMAQDNAIPVVVFKLDEPGNIKRALLDQTVGTVVHS